MKREIDPKIIAVVIGILVLTILGIGWKVFGPGQNAGMQVTHPTNG